MRVRIRLRAASREERRLLRIFHGGKTAAYRQIGNAFPPPVARAFGTRIREALLERYQSTRGPKLPKLLTPDKLDAIAFYDKPLLKFERLLETYLSVAPRGFRQFTAAMPVLRSPEANRASWWAT